MAVMLSYLITYSINNLIIYYLLFLFYFLKKKMMGLDVECLV